MSLSRHLSNRSKVCPWSLAFRKERRRRKYINRELEKIRIFGSKKEEVTTGRRKLLSKRLRDVYSSPNIIRVMKSRRVRRAEPARRLVCGRTKIFTKFWWNSLKKNTI
jgi:hypothetical protein